jgi:hypothetical protein
MSKPAVVYPISIQRMVCTGCGAEANASCNCGKPYVPKAERAREAIKANPKKSDRAIAAGIGVHHSTINEARKQLSDHPTVERIGLDGNTRKLPQRADDFAVKDVIVDKIRKAVVADYLGDRGIVEQALVLVGKMDDDERHRFDAATLRFCDATLN